MWLAMFRRRHVLAIGEDVRGDAGLIKLNEQERLYIAEAASWNL